MPFCTQCGFEVSDNFCPRCGSPTRDAPSQGPQQPSPLPEDSRPDLRPIASQAQTTSSRSQAPPKNPRKKRIGWALVILLGLGLLGVVAVVQGWMPETAPANTPAAVAERFVRNILAGRTSRAMDLVCPHGRFSRSVAAGLFRQGFVQAKQMFGEAENIAVQSVAERRSTASVVVGVQLRNLMDQWSHYPVHLVKENGEWKVDPLCGRGSSCLDADQMPPEYEPVEVGRHYAGTITNNEHGSPRVTPTVIVIISRSQSQVTIEQITSSNTDTWTGTYDPATHSLALRADPADFFDLQYGTDDHWKGLQRLVKGRLPNGERDYASFPVELSTR